MPVEDWGVWSALCVPLGDIASCSVDPYSAFKHLVWLCCLSGRFHLRLSFQSALECMPPLPFRKAGLLWRYPGLQRPPFFARLLVTSVMLAVKFFDDVYYSNAYYAKAGIHFLAFG